MKISEMIKRLEIIKLREGDLRVTCEYFGGVQSLPDHFSGVGFMFDRPDSATFCHRYWEYGEAEQYKGEKVLVIYR